MENIKVSRHLEDMKSHIERFSSAAENCDLEEIIPSVQQIGESIGHVHEIFWEHGKNKEQLIEFQSLYSEYEKTQDKLLKCSCTKK